MRHLAPIDILAAVAAAYQISVEELSGEGRRAKGGASWPRHLAAWLLRQQWPDLPFMAIARYLGMRDHTSAIYAIEKVEGRFSLQPGQRGAALALLARLTATTTTTRRRMSSPSREHLRLRGSCNRRNLNFAGREVDHV